MSEGEPQGAAVVSEGVVNRELQIFSQHRGVFEINRFNGPKKSEGPVDPLSFRQQHVPALFRVHLVGRAGVSSLSRLAPTTGASPKRAPAPH